MWRLAAKVGQPFLLPLNVPKRKEEKKKTKEKGQLGPEASTPPYCSPRPVAGLAPPLPQSQPALEVDWLVGRALLHPPYDVVAGAASTLWRPA